MKLLLTSQGTNAEQDTALIALVGKEPVETRVACIENAYDIYDDEASMIESRDELRAKGFRNLAVVDLRDWTGKHERLRDELAGTDMFYLVGGNPFYLRWLMKTSGADEIIRELVAAGAVYAGASAAAVVAGPTLRFFDNQDDPAEAGEVIWDGLGLTQTVVVPHIDDADFGAGCREAGEKCRAAGYATTWLTNTQALVIDGDRQEVM